ncbi:hypothetical protein CHUAL_012639 [Chamberlinius hualienensis]
MRHRPSGDVTFEDSCCDWLLASGVTHIWKKRDKKPFPIHKLVFSQPRLSIHNNRPKLRYVRLRCIAFHCVENRRETRANEKRCCANPILPPTLHQTTLISPSISSLRGGFPFVKKIYVMSSSGL